MECFYQFTTGVLSFITFLVIGWQVLTMINNAQMTRNYVKTFKKDLENKMKADIAAAKADVLMTLAIRTENAGTIDGFNLALLAVIVAYEEGADEKTINSMMECATGLFNTQRTSVTPAFYERIGEFVYFSKIKGKEMDEFKRLFKELKVNDVN